MEETRVEQEQTQDEIMLVSQQTQPQPNQCQHLNQTESPFALCQVCEISLCEECFFNPEMATTHLHHSQGTTENILQTKTLLRNCSQKLATYLFKLQQITNASQIKKQ
jgi:hypothetical protein